ncbi:unnamed protein product [Ambrosiozyma monospora]|uniref:Unnamed protein product n=1 Tax=Ambrosiozyma monospora TaxID=43982 RepID=A0A9W6YZ38_AMBMO|nr:unnamed protein product [Ambrosiozyma monospora]
MKFLLFTLGHQTLLRGDSRRGMRLMDVKLVDKTPSVGALFSTPKECIAITIVKEKVIKSKKFMESMVLRHKDANLCAIAAIGMFLFFKLNSEEDLLALNSEMQYVSVDDFEENCNETLSEFSWLKAKLFDFGYSHENSMISKTLVFPLTALKWLLEEVRVQSLPLTT